MVLLTGNALILALLLWQTSDAAPEGTKGKELTAWRKEHRWAPNRLRHSRATEIRERYGLEAAQAVLGHSQAGSIAGLQFAAPSEPEPMIHLGRRVE